jgi:hypothetical protein
MQESDLPDLEYFIVDRNLPSTEETGPGITGVVQQPTFIPSSLGVSDTTTLEFIPIAYDLDALHQIIDILLNNTTNSGTPCCDLFLLEPLCDGLNSAGINEPSDFTSLSQLFDILASNNSDIYSIADLESIIEQINNLFAFSFPIPAACGGGSAPDVCYAYGEACIFKVIDLIETIILQPPAHQMDTIILANSISSSAMVQTFDSVQYKYRTEVNLLPGFEVFQGGVFEISKGSCPEDE